MKRQEGSALATTLVALVVLACAEARPVPAQPASAAGPDASAVAFPDASAPAAPVSPDAGEGPDAAAPPPAVEWKLIDTGSKEKGQVGPCDPATRFVSLKSVLAKPVPGPIAVRGRAWAPAVYPCTAGIPEACFALPVLAPSRPQDGSSRAQVVLHGYVAPYEQWACTGRHGALNCALPLEGREYGVTGTLRVSQAYDEAPLLELDVEKLCGFR